MKVLNPVLHKEQLLASWSGTHLAFGAFLMEPTVDTSVGINVLDKDEGDEEWTSWITEEEGAELDPFQISDIIQLQKDFFYLEFPLIVEFHPNFEGLERSFPFW